MSTTTCAEPGWLKLANAEDTFRGVMERDNLVVPGYTVELTKDGFGRWSKIVDREKGTSKFQTRQVIPNLWKPEQDQYLSEEYDTTYGTRCKFCLSGAGKYKTAHTATLNITSPINFNLECWDPLVITPGQVNMYIDDSLVDNTKDWIDTVNTDLKGDLTIHCSSGDVTESGREFMLTAGIYAKRQLVA